MANFRTDCIIDANTNFVEAVGESWQQLADFTVFIKIRFPAISIYYKLYSRSFLIKVSLWSSHMLCELNNENFQENVFSLFQLLKRLTGNNNLCCLFFFRLRAYFRSYNETLCKAISPNLEDFGYFRILIFFPLFGGNSKMKSIGIHKMKTASLYILHLNQAWLSWACWLMVHKFV